MKTIKIDIDFIGGLGLLTKIEEKELSDFFKSRKLSVKKTARDNYLSNRTYLN